MRFLDQSYRIIGFEQPCSMTDYCARQEFICEIACLTHHIPCLPNVHGLRTHPRAWRAGEGTQHRVVRRLSLFYSSVVIFQNFIITPFTVSVYEFIGGVPWMLP